MPANRSRTLNWRRCLQQIHERRGSIDIAVDSKNETDETGSHLVWRVRVLDLSDEEILIEQPTALGQVIPIEKDISLIAIMTVGQNRWMFSTVNIDLTRYKGTPAREIPALRLRMPTGVRRCQRRRPRVYTGALNLPEVEIWPLLDPKSVIVAERASELAFERREHDAAATDPSDPAVMPELGPRFETLLLNLGGGGVGLLVPPEHNQILSRHKIFWMRISLPSDLIAPICATAKLIHTHMQADQHLYAGLAFDFSFNPGHQRLVVNQICRFVSAQQRRQFEGHLTEGPMRQTG